MKRTESQKFFEEMECKPFGFFKQIKFFWEELCILWYAFQIDAHIKYINNAKCSYFSKLNYLIKYGEKLGFLKRSAQESTLMNKKMRKIL